MSEDVEVDLDEATGRAWTAYYHALLDRLRNSAADDVIEIGLEAAVEDDPVDCADHGAYHCADHGADHGAAGSTPYIRILLSGDQAVLETPRNRALHPSWRLDRAARDRLLDEALVTVLGDLPERDEDGDIVVETNRSVLYVRTMTGSPLIRIWSRLSFGITDAEAAKFEIGVLNRDWPSVKFLLLGNTIVADLVLPGYPFVPHLVRSSVALMRKAVDEVGRDLSVRVGGTWLYEPATEATEATEGDAERDAERDAEEDTAGNAGAVPPALLTLWHLEVEKPGSLTPALVAHVCDHDRDALLEFIRFEECEEIAWREHRDEVIASGGPDHEAEASEHERAHAERMVRLLRKTLRRVVTEGSSG